MPHQLLPTRDLVLSVAISEPLPSPASAHNKPFSIQLLSVSKPGVGTLQTDKGTDGHKAHSYPSWLRSPRVSLGHSPLPLATFLFFR